MQARSALYLFLRTYVIQTLLQAVMLVPKIDTPDFPYEKVPVSV